MNELWDLDWNHIAHFECGTPFLNALYRDIERYRRGEPFQNGTVMDEVEFVVYDDWDKVGRRWTEERGDEDIFSPLISMAGEEPDRLLSEDEIDGFIPERGHEYKLLVRRFYYARNPVYHKYELIEILEDKTL